MGLIRQANRDVILKKDLYYHKGFRMVDLFRWYPAECIYDCYPCAVRRI